MEIREKTVDRNLLLELSGELDHHAARKAMEEMEMAIDAAVPLKLVLDFGFRQLRLNRIEAQHEVDNPASGAVMRKAGMTYEGTLRQRLCNKGKFVDVALYAALRSEYTGKKP